MAWLVQTIESEIIPRLMAAHQPSAALKGQYKESNQHVSPEEVVEFSDLCMVSEAQVCLAYIEVLLKRGVSLSTIYLELLAPAARRLGQMWVDDQCQFTETTIGLWRMQQVMHDLSPVFQLGGRRTDRSPYSIMLATIPDSQHSFGLQMVAEYFRRAGWTVQHDSGAPRAELMKTLSQTWFDVVGLSISLESQLCNLSELITELRNQSKNPALKVILGGPLCYPQPEAMNSFGADATAVDASQAVSIAETLAQAAEPEQQLVQSMRHTN